MKEELTKIIFPHIIIIVNNAATNESNITLADALDAELLNDISIKPDIRNKVFIISRSENLGFAKGNNLGAEFSRKHFNISHFLFTNNDIHLIDNNVIEILISKLDSLQDVAMIGPKVIGSDGRFQSPEPYYSFWMRYFWMYWLTPFLSIKRKMKLFKIEYSQLAKEGRHYKITGSFLLVKAEDFFRCGMMDSATFLYAEEIILSERLMRIGKKVYYNPEVSVLHEHGRTISKYQDNEQRRFKQFESEAYYYRKYMGVSHFSILIGKLTLICYNKLINKMKMRNLA